MSHNAHSVQYYFKIKFVKKKLYIPKTIRATNKMR